MLEIHLLGMQKRGKGNTDTLTYNGTGKPARRRAAGCVARRCAGNPGTTCDEVSHEWLSYGEY